MIVVGEKGGERGDRRLREAYGKEGGLKCDEQVLMRGKDDGLGMVA